MRLILTGGSGFIGTNFITSCLGRPDITLLNLDISAPLNPEHNKYWQRADIMNPEELKKHVAQFQPTAVIHLAARTDCDENTNIEDYAVNIQGTQNVLDALATTGTVDTLVVVSTQFVLGPGVQPESDWHYQPHTVYGESKCRMEKLVRESAPPYKWFFVRPVNIWGPWHMRYKKEFWHTVEKGWYFHPGGEPVVRTYGYVKNLVWQILELMKQDAENVRGKPFYVGDEPADIYEWTNAFSKALTGKPARRVPRLFLWALGLAGNMLSIMGVNFPITLSRYKSMTSHYETPTASTRALIGDAPYELEKGVQETVKWLNSSS